MTTFKTFGPVDERAFAQLVRCAEAGNAAYGVLCADHHVGYSQPIGGVLAYADYVSPSGVGYDIGCGNKAVKTNMLARDVPVAAMMDEITRRVSFGVGRVNSEPVDDAVLDRIRSAEFGPQRQLYDLAAKQLGTVGSGNHYVDLFEDREGWLWVGVHFGSRGFGHKTASGFLALAQGKTFDTKVKDGEMDSPPVLFRADSELGQAYVSAMELAGLYAYAGRNAVCATVLDILGAGSVRAVHNHHNFAWREEHFGQSLWVVRKGATSAYGGEEGFVGASMGDPSVVLVGLDNHESREALFSTVHGAGRVLSRTQAAGKWRKVKEQRTNPEGKVYTFNRRERDPSTGLVDWEDTKLVLAGRGIALRGGGADEAPAVYKDLTEVLAYHQYTVKVKEVLWPLGVAMAGPDTVDPYKD